MAEDWASEINPNSIKHQSLAAIEGFCIGDGKRELLALESVSGVETVIKCDPKEKNVFMINLWCALQSLDHLNGEQSSSQTGHHGLNVLAEPLVGGKIPEQSNHRICSEFEVVRWKSWWCCPGDIIQYSVLAINFTQVLSFFEAVSSKV